MSAVPGSELSQHWDLDPEVTFLNHGSFGACPREVLAEQARLRRQMEREPVRFFDREAEGLVDAARETLARFLGASPEDLAFVPNATTGVNTVLRSLPFQPDDEILVCDHEYGATKNAAQFAAERAGARLIVTRLPFPLEDPSQVVEAFVQRVSPKTRLVVVDHVTSPTGLVLPLAELISALDELGVDVLVDGAHAPGMLPLALDRLGASYYTGNLHKWVCAPKGAAFLHVRRDRQPLIRPLVISHGATRPATDRSRFHLEMDWTGTSDITAWLSVPKALEVMAGLLPGGWEAVMAHNRDLATRARELLCTALGTPPLAPAAMLGSLATVLVPDGPTKDPQARHHPLANALFEAGFELPWIEGDWGRPGRPRRMIRVSAQVYNALPQYSALAGELTRLLAAEAQAVSSS